ncbi:hypothetical protein HFN01_19375 [Rhizobium leguminosarum]|uniref:hypothetical protein n=1 Tax=Rhizobium leguminosarum TaxID=384 RepID=UPI001C96BAD1|nr:hypothetical protein [Rhizobium leguminosarum]MBY5396973.1 hypothetical protein [Rhizobium leguminosarum]
MEQTARLRFGELVTLLDTLHPETLEKIRQQFPKAGAQLRAGEVMGETEAPVGCTVAIVALTKFNPLVTALLPRLRSRLRWSWRFDLVAKFTAAVGSGGTVAALAAGAGADKAVITAIVALVGSLASLIFAHLQRDESAGSVPEAYNKMIDALVQAEELQRSLPALCSSGDGPELRSALDKANETARDLNRLWMRYSA